MKNIKTKPLSPKTRRMLSQSVANLNAPKRIDLQTEEFRVYTFATRHGLVEVVIDEPLFMVDSPNGHRIVDVHNNGHYIPKGWVHLTWVNKPGATPLVH
jgi:hypothetical protein